mgnify:CR=1 FL=1
MGRLPIICQLNKRTRGLKYSTKKCIDLLSVWSIAVNLKLIFLSINEEHTRKVIAWVS